jgi:hypothetical protein
LFPMEPNETMSSDSTGKRMVFGDILLIFIQTFLLPT